MENDANYVRRIEIGANHFCAASDTVLSVLFNNL